MRYLLDELMTYEEGFTDILMGDRSSDRHETFMGEKSPADPANFVRLEDFHKFQDNLMQSLTTFLTPHKNMPSIPHPTTASSSNYPTPMSYGILV